MNIKNFIFRFELVFHNLVIFNFDSKISTKWYSVNHDNRKFRYEANESLDPHLFNHVSQSQIFAK